MTAATLTGDRPVIVDMFCGSGGESQGIDWSAKRAGIVKEIGNAVCPLMAEALTAGYMRELVGMVA